MRIYFPNLAQLKDLLPGMQFKPKKKIIDEDKNRPNFSNLDCQTRKQKQKHDMCKIKIQQNFIARKKTRL